MSASRPGALPFGLAFYDSLGPVLASALPAFVVVAAVGGRRGVRELAGRCLRWRARLRWYGVALFSVPVSVLLVMVVIHGPQMLEVLADRWVLILTTTLPHLLILIVSCIVAEEAGFLGFLQARWQDRFGPVAASALVALPFAAYHLPGTMVANGFGVPSAVVVAFAVALLVLTRGRLGDPVARRRGLRSAGTKTAASTSVRRDSSPRQDTVR